MQRHPMQLDDWAAAPCAADPAGAPAAQPHRGNNRRSAAARRPEQEDAAPMQGPALAQMQWPPAQQQWLPTEDYRQRSSQQAQKPQPQQKRQSYTRERAGRGGPSGGWQPQAQQQQQRQQQQQQQQQQTWHQAPTHQQRQQQHQQRPKQQPRQSPAAGLPVPPQQQHQQRLIEGPPRYEPLQLHHQLQLHDQAACAGRPHVGAEAEHAQQQQQQQKEQRPRSGAWRAQQQERPQAQDDGQQLPKARRAAPSQPGQGAGAGPPYAPAATMQWPKLGGKSELVAKQVFFDATEQVSEEMEKEVKSIQPRRDFLHQRVEAALSAAPEDSPLRGCELQVVGSASWGGEVPQSDLDLALLTPGGSASRCESIQLLRELMGLLEETDAELLEAPRVSILRIRHAGGEKAGASPLVSDSAKQGLSCDICVDQLHTLRHRTMLNNTLQGRPEVLRFVRLVKLWLRRRGLPMAGEGGAERVAPQGPAGFAARPSPSLCLVALRATRPSASPPGACAAMAAPVEGAPPAAAAAPGEATAAAEACGRLLQRGSTTAAELMPLLRPLEALGSSGGLCEVEEPAAAALVSGLCSWLRARAEPPEEGCLGSALRVLAALLGAEGQGSAEAVALQKGLLTIVRDVLGGPARGSASIVECCMELAAALGVADGSDQVIGRLGLVPLIVDQLQEFGGDHVVLEAAATALALLARRTRHRHAALRCGAIGVLVDVLRRCSDRQSLVVAVCRFVANFAVKEDCRLAVLRGGGVDALAALVSTGAGDAGAATASALLACATDCEEVQQRLCSLQVATDVLRQMQASPLDVALHEAGIGIFRCLSRASGSGRRRGEALAEGAVPLTLEAMRRFGDSSALLKEACGLLGNLAADPEAREQLGRAGAVEVVVATLSRCDGEGDRKVAKLALGALSNLANDSEANRELMAAHAAAPALLRAAQVFAHNESILESAIAAVAHMASNALCRQHLLEAGAVEALLLFLSEGADDFQVVARSLAALRRLLRRPGGGRGGADAAVARKHRLGGLPRRLKGCWAAGGRAAGPPLRRGPRARRGPPAAGRGRGARGRAPAAGGRPEAVPEGARASPERQGDVAEAVTALLAQLPIEEDQRFLAEALGEPGGCAVCLGGA
ncbi:unnamed protein product [Prorocentrum cordatum]|uniref:Poly(A) RNA polymerase mitochondrial-like central palm domain-containing protein n=1 Tax=Prorocentrum cordatum TaxID=2364126 RepID=A0ABN9YDC4_9DINO|nr:unnamed protein product [Polarella glacialis]